MRINIITYNNQYGLTHDINVLIHQLKTHFRDGVEIFAVNFFDYKCNYVDLNIFLETVSYTLFKYAPINILIPNQEWYYKTWTPYIRYFDKILVKSNYGEAIFKQLVKSQGGDDKKVINIGWQSSDKYDSKIHKDYQKYLHVCGKSKHKQTQAIIDSWLPEFPELTIIYSPKDVDVVEKTQDNIIYIRERVSDATLIKMLNESGVHICCSDTEGFGHYIQEAKSCQAVVLTVDAPPMNNFVNTENGYLVKYSSKKPVKHALGSKYILDVNSLRDTVKIIEETRKTNESHLSELGKKARESYLDTCTKFNDTMKTVFRDIFELAISIGKEYKKIKAQEETEVIEMMKDENLPPITIITPTYNRRHMFRVALFNYINFNYPRDKLQWVIVDDSEENQRISDMIPNEEDIDIKYIALDRRVPIGKKRNICVEHADNNIIVSMDDDDYYPPNSLKIRVLELLKSKKRCVTCTTIACFHINKLISMINVPPHKLSFSERISEATLTFYKDFWKERPFKDESYIGESKEFLDGRVDDCREISWEGVIVSLMHNRNTSGKITMGDSPNGCHYGWSDKLYLFLTNLDTELEPSEEAELIKVRKGNYQFANEYKIIEYRNLKHIPPSTNDNKSENDIVVHANPIDS
jgi:glycosyltransferase involved in cell wall biosynthesis